MATPTTEDRRIESQLSIIYNGLSAAYKVLENQRDSDIKSSSYSGYFRNFTTLHAKVEDAMRELTTIRNRVK